MNAYTNTADTVASHIAARVAEDQAQVNDVVLANGTGQLAGRGISATPEDRHDPKAMTAEVAADLPKVETTKPVSIFAKPAAVVAPVEEAAPIEAMGEAPAPEEAPVRKSIFSFPKSA